MGDGFAQALDLNGTRSECHSYEDVCDMWKNRRVKTLPFYSRFFIKMCAESNRIANIDISYNSTLEIFNSEVVSNYSGDIRALYSVMNNKNVSAFLSEAYRERKSVTPELIKEVHRLLMFGSIDNYRYHNNGERAGHYRTHNYCVGKYDVVGVAFGDIAKAIESLCEVCADDGIDPLKRATVFHCYFANIHPFSDGNGRVCRWLTNYFLVLNGHPPIIFPSEERETYFSALEKFDMEEDYDTLLQWFRKQTVSSYTFW